MTHSVLETVIQQIQHLTPDEQIVLSKHLDNLTHQQNPSAIIRSQLKIIKSHREEIIQLASLYGASNIRTFTIDRETHQSSHDEVNFLVDLAADRNLLDLGGLLMDLRELLGFDVFVFTESTLKDHYRQPILQNAIAI